MKVHIVCYGNEFMGDDAAGILVYRNLLTKNFPKEIQIFNAGISGSRSISLFEGADIVCLIDSVVPSGKPGRIVYCNQQQLMRNQIQKKTLHEMDFGTLLNHFYLLDPKNQATRFLFLGIEAKNISGFSLHISEEVEFSSQTLSDKIESKIRQLFKRKYN